MRTNIRALAAVVLFTAMAGCAPQVVRDPASLAPTPAPPRAFTAESTTSYRLATGYMRQITAGTRFVEVGRIAQGSVLRPVNTVLSVEGADVHEAYAVVNSGMLVGFYLPFEKAFSPMTPVPFSLKDAAP